MNNGVYREVWDLDSIFPGGSESPQFVEHLRSTEIKIKDFNSKIGSIVSPKSIAEAEEVAELIKLISEIEMNVLQAKSFVVCLLAQNPKDQKAPTLDDKVGYLNANFETSVKRTQQLLQQIEEKLWNEMLDTEILSNYKYILNEWRQKGRLQLSESEERLISDLMIDGYHAWYSFYKTLMSGIKVKVSISGKENTLSVGQAINLRADPNAEVRKASHEALENVWKEKEGLFAQILNHIAGFRLQVYKTKGVENILEEPLFNNRIKSETLDVMWGAVDKHKNVFIKYLNGKAGILGDAKLNSYHFWAPITKSEQHIDYDEAVKFVTSHLSQFGPELASFISNAFEKGWVESENRPNKSAVPFCTGFPQTGESRVYMTYSGTIKDLLTLTHELGHAFHNYAMEDVDSINKQYPMSLAETASTFLEMIVLDAAIDQATTNKDKLLLLDEKLKRSVMNFMNINARFLFEKKFYEERKQGFVTATRLNTLMKESMDIGYNGSLGHIPVHSWVWTPHFYITKSPFYNFPYTFGYLLSLSIYAKAKEKGRGFEKDYLSFLRDSGSMSTEELVMKHLGEDITSESFWEKGMDLCMNDVKEFIELADSTMVTEETSSFNTHN
ncbi:M3 family oligoendopeptidase [Oceanobacillus manasiensis]|uniref:M3 family oligoendopeptidase n=1 Tax=Oceanobacillus manasiensis TaxID=586413 RepID=UPI0005A686E2|nr:M3 family oligoendopeptidase [Oceanobacillus manasiensis]